MKAALGLTLTVAGIYLLTASGHLSGQDQEYYYRMARAFAQEHSFAIEPLRFQNTEIAGGRGPNGNFYAQYAPGLPVALAPLVMVADFFPGSVGDFATHYFWVRDRENDALERVFASYFNIGVAPAAAGVLLLLVKRLRYPTRTAMYIAGIFALSTFSWGQSRIINPEPVQTLLIMSAVGLALGATKKRALLAGCVLGCATLVKMTSVLALPALLILAMPKRSTTPAQTWKTAASILLPVATALLIYTGYNYARFGDPFATGYTVSSAAAKVTGNGIGNPLIGLYGLLISTGRGLLWYAPPILAGVAGFSNFYRKEKRVAIAFVLLIGMWIALHACYQSWDSGWGWGPRYLLPILPFMLIPTAEFLQRRSGNVICVALAIIGFLIQIPGALVDFMASGRAGMALFAQSGGERTMTSFVAWRNFHIAGSEIVRNLALLKEGQLDLAWITFGGTALPTITFALVAIFLATGIALLLSELHSTAKGKISSAQPHDSVNPDPPCP